MMVRVITKNIIELMKLKLFKPKGEWVECPIRRNEMEKWIVSQEMYDEFQKLKNNEYVKTLYDALNCVEEDAYKYPEIHEELFNPIKALLFAKAWAGEIEIVV